jgi:LPXTG-motif cell wall-anchored protein
MLQKSTMNWQVILNNNKVDMKKSVLVFLLATLFILGGMNIAISQEQPKPKRDTVNMDTDAKPQFYYPVEDEKAKPKGSSSTIVIIAGAVVLAGAAGFFLLKKKK